MESIAQTLLNDLLAPSEIESIESIESTKKNVERKTQSVHEKEENEENASDAGGTQGGQRWSPPTQSPTLVPTDQPTEGPTDPPSFHPTPHGEPFVLKGVIWYDRNANASRDNGITMPEYGSDVEYSMGLGGVTVTLLECNADTNRGKSECLFN
eukprot:scaffold159697_cov56-Cyclotella_meneghiniana.AAC.7